MIQLFGASGHGKVIAEILQARGIQEICFLDDALGIPPRLLSFQVLPSDQFSLENPVIISVGNNTIRKQIAKRLGIAKFECAIHPNAVLSPSATIGSGTVMMANSVINSCSTVGQHSIINTASTIDHDCVLGDFVHICPNASLAGNVQIGEGTQVGIGAQIIQGIKVGKWCVIGAGSVIIQDIPDFSVVVGNPGKVIKVKMDHE